MEIRGYVHVAGIKGVTAAGKRAAGRCVDAHGGSTQKRQPVQDVAVVHQSRIGSRIRLRRDRRPGVKITDGLLFGPSKTS